MSAAAATDHSEFYLRFASKIGVITESDLKRELKNYSGQKTTEIGKTLVEKGVLHPNNFKLLESMFARQLTRMTHTVHSATAEEEKLPTEKITAVALEEKRDAIAKGDTTKLKGSPISVSRYRIVRPLTTSRLAELFIAEDSELHREVVFKRLQAQHQKAPGYRIRFNRTAEVTSGLEHPCIPPIYNHGLDPDGRPYYTTRYLIGETLAESVARLFAAEPVDPPRSIDTRTRPEGLRKHVQRLLQVCSAISYAHGRGVMHCGLTPERILLGRYSETLVVGWGRAELIYGRKPKPSTIEMKPDPVGEKPAKGQSRKENPTPYTSPEQLAADTAAGGILSDVYSLGALLHFIATGKPPFEGSADELVAKAMEGRSAESLAEVEAASPTLASVCTKAMAVDPMHRFTSVREFAAELDEWLDARPARAVNEPTIAAVPTRGPRTKPRINLKTAIAACAITGILGVALGGIFNVAWARQPAPASHAMPEPANVPTTASQSTTIDFTPYICAAFGAAAEASNAADLWFESIERKAAERSALLDARRSARDGRFDEACRRTPNVPDTSLAVERAEWLGFAGRHADAAAAFRRLADRKSKDELRALIGLIEQRLALGETPALECDAAETLLAKAKPDPILGARFDAARGACLVKTGKNKEGAEAFQKATGAWNTLAAGPIVGAAELRWAAGAWDGLRQTHAKEQRMADALAAAQRAVALLERIPAKATVVEWSAAINADSGVMYFQLGKLKEAESAFTRIIEGGAADSTNARYLRGACRLESKNVVGAREDAEALAKGPKAEAKYLAARVFAKLSTTGDASTNAAAQMDGGRAVSLMVELQAGKFFTGERAELPTSDPELDGIRQRADFKDRFSPQPGAKATANPSGPAP